MEKREIECNHRRPEMDLTQRFVVHIPAPFRQPIVDRGHGGEYRTWVKDVVNVCHHEESVVILKIDRGDGQHESR